MPPNSELTRPQKHDGVAEQEATPETVKLTKAERRAQHAELNRQIWESAYVCPSHVTMRALY